MLQKAICADGEGSLPILSPAGSSLGVDKTKGMLIYWVQSFKKPGARSSLMTKWQFISVLFLNCTILAPAPDLSLDLHMYVYGHLGLFSAFQVPHVVTEAFLAFDRLSL